jgi:hypothetical protein
VVLVVVVLDELGGVQSPVDAATALDAELGSVLGAVLGAVLSVDEPGWPQPTIRVVVTGEVQLGPQSTDSV